MLRRGIGALLLCLLFCAGVANLALAQQVPSGPVTMQGPTMPPVKFPHNPHARVAGKCEVCHHLSKPEKPNKSPQQPCLDCHTKPPTPPVNIGLPAAFHNSSASAGLCITCHKTEDANGKAAPLKCANCHKKEG